MIAIVVALGTNESYGGLQEHLPVPMLPLADKPFIQHVVEYLANNGIRQFHFILSHLPEKIEAALGDGARWGCNFQYHLLPADADPFRFAGNIAVAQNADAVLADAECLPHFDLPSALPGTIIVRAAKWIRWAVLSPADFNLPNLDSHRQIEAEPFLSIESGTEFLRSQRDALELRFPGLLIAGRQADPGVWIARNVVLHPTAKVTAPVYVGENSRIGRGAVIGPSAVIGQNCIIDEHTIVVDSMVAAGTYVGEGLELNAVIVDRNRLLNTRLETTLLASEAFLLGSLTGRNTGREMYRLLSMAIALVLLLLLWPLLLLAGLFLMVAKPGSVGNKRILSIPADDDPGAWRETEFLSFDNRPGDLQRASLPGDGAGSPGGRAEQFFRHFLPGLVAVLQGKLFLVGVQPRSKESVLALPSDWRSLYLNTKAGVITESSVMFGGNPSEDELYTAEAVYSATESIRNDLRLLALWFSKLVTGFPKPGADPVSEDLN